MNIFLNPHAIKPEPPRPVTASLPERRNEGTLGAPGDGHYPILTQHWPGFPLPWAKTASDDDPDTYERQVQTWRQGIKNLVVASLKDGS